jgi:hypothetical protein
LKSFTYSVGTIYRVGKQAGERAIECEKNWLRVAGDLNFDQPIAKALEQGLRDFKYGDALVMKIIRVQLSLGYVLRSFITLPGLPRLTGQ